MDTRKIKEFITNNETTPKLYEQDYFRLGICEVQLGNYLKAKELFFESVTVMFGSNPFWKKTSQPNWLVDISLLSGRSEIYPSLLEELTIYRTTPSKSGPVGTSPIAHYCYSVMEILHPGFGNITEWIKDLKKRPKYKDLYATGFVLQAIIDKDQEAFSQSIQSLLMAHQGLAKHGELRLVPEGWLCLPAMTLSLLAFKKSLKVEFTNDYLSLGYLTYLLGHEVTDTGT